MTETASVRVVARLRPFLDGEDNERCIAVEGSQVVLNDPRRVEEEQRFDFDRCFEETVSQDAVFDSEAQPLVEGVFSGLNTTLFCYGVTGSGKTFTMSGIVPRTIKAIFGLAKEAEAAHPGGRCIVQMSFLQILNEKVQDLLQPANDDLPLRENKEKKILIPGLSEEVLTDEESFTVAYDRALKNRSTAATAMNQGSSRSHAVLIIKVTHANGVNCGKLHLIDLAGSEDNRSTGNSGARIVESANINKSLFNLGKVIDSLNEKATVKGGAVHVPYRDSKLTRLLQDSLGGGARSTMFINLPPGLLFFHHVMNTLSFAAKSRRVVNKPVVNTMPVEEKKAETMQEKLARFKAEKDARRRSDSTNPMTPTPASKSKKRKTVEAFGTAKTNVLQQPDAERDGQAKKMMKAIEQDELLDMPSDSMGLCDKAFLLTPGAQMKQAKKESHRAQMLERDNCLNTALQHYQNAFDLVPTDKLEKKIAHLKGVLGNIDDDDMFSTKPSAPPVPPSVVRFGSSLIVS